MARGEDGPSTDLDLVVAAEPDDLSDVVSSIRTALYEIGEKLGFIASVVGVPSTEMASRSKTDPFWAAVHRDGILL